MINPALRIALCALSVAACAAAVRLGATEGAPSPSTAGGSSAGPRATAPPIPLADALGVRFVDASTSTMILERDGKKYLVDIATRTVKEVESPPAPPALPPAQLAGQTSRQAPQKARPASQNAEVYEPGDDYLFSLPTGRRLDRHGFYVNFSHRFAFDPAFSGPARGGALLGLDGLSLSSFGFRYGVTKRLSVSIYRSPSLIGRPIQLMGAYNLTDERHGQPFNSTFRFSVEGRDDFARDFTENFEGILSRSLTSRAQIYFVPTLSLNNRRLLQGGFRSREILDVPGINSFALGVGGSLDVRPTVALVAEVIPTLAHGRDLGIHRPAYSFGIQKKIWRHAFTFGFSTSPGTTVSQRAGTRATFLDDPSADTPSGLFVGFDLTRQIY